jgi:hypothetical protein
METQLLVEALPAWEEASPFVNEECGDTMWGGILAQNELGQAQDSRLTN